MLKCDGADFSKKNRNSILQVLFYKKLHLFGFSLKTGHCFFRNFASSQVPKSLRNWHRRIVQENSYFHFISNIVFYKKQSKYQKIWPSSVSFSETVWPILLNFITCQSVMEANHRNTKLLRKCLKMFLYKYQMYKKF